METVQEIKTDKEIRQLFFISVALKGVASLAEIVSGLVVLFVPVSFFTDFAIYYAQGELLEEPGDFIASHLLQLAQQFSLASGTFIAFYLLSRGIIKFGLVVALLKERLWAYPASLAVLGLFVAYQVYQIALTRSVLIILLTLFDLIVIYFIWREYRIVEKQVRERAA